MQIAEVIQLDWIGDYTELEIGLEIGLILEGDWIGYRFELFIGSKLGFDWIRFGFGDEFGYDVDWN